MLSKAKETQSEGEEAPAANSNQRSLIESTDSAEIYNVEGSELPLYSSKTSEKDKLGAALADNEVHSAHISNGKPVLLMHSKHGPMHTSFSLSASNAAKMLKTIEIPVITTTAKGDGGLILSIEKIREEISVVDLINEGTLSAESAAFLWFVIEGKTKPANVLIVGSGADRIELVNALSAFIPSSERVAVVNGVAHASHWNDIEMPFEQAVEKASEMKFDRIIGEIHLKKARVLHYLEGRLKGILSMPGNTSGEAVHILRETIGRAVNAVDVVVSVHRIKGIKIIEISEVVNSHASPLYATDIGTIARVKLESNFVNSLIHHGVSRKAIESELREKQKTLEGWNENGKRSNKEIRIAMKNLN